MNYTEVLMALSPVHVLNEIAVVDDCYNGTRISSHSGLVWARNDYLFPYAD
jgi:hypothetical protein